MKPLESEEADLDEGGMSRQYHGDSRDEVEEGEIVEEGEAPEKGGDRVSVLTSEFDGGDHHKADEKSEKISFREKEKGFQGTGKPATSKPRFEEKSFTKDEENNAVRLPGLGGANCSANEKNVAQRSEKQNNSVDGKKRKSSKEKDTAEKLLKVSPSNPSESNHNVSAAAASKVDNVEKNLEDSHKLVGVESRGGREVKGKSNLAGEGEYLETGRETGEGKVLKVSALDQNNVKGDIKQNKEKKFSSESKTGANVFKVPSCSSGKGSKGVAGQSSGRSERSKSEVVRCSKSVKEGESRTAKKGPRAGGKRQGEVWEGFDFQKLNKVKCERPAEKVKAEKVKTEEKGGVKRQVDGKSVEEENKSKKRCIEEDRSSKGKVAKVEKEKRKQSVNGEDGGQVKKDKSDEDKPRKTNETKVQGGEGLVPKSRKEDSGKGSRDCSSSSRKRVDGKQKSNGTGREERTGDQERKPCDQGPKNDSTSRSGTKKDVVVGGKPKDNGEEVKRDADRGEDRGGDREDRGKKEASSAADELEEWKDEVFGFVEMLFSICGNSLCVGVEHEGAT